ncbi:MAG: hypothetical protein NVSMB24_37880 [Mucilaginibacter sp.]
MRMIYPKNHKINSLLQKNMSGNYFKFRARFDFSPHRYDLGRPIFQNRGLEDNFFVLKIYELSQPCYSDFYKYQLDYYLKKHPSQEEGFFKHVHDVVVNRIKHFKRLDPFSSKYAAGLENTRKLEAFLGYLKSIDCWHKTEPIESVIGEKDRLIDQLRQRIEELESQLKEIAKYDAGEKIMISKGGLPAFIHLIKQFQDIILPNGNKLVNTQTQSPWYKMIAKSFMHGDKDISIDTARNYFPAQKDDQPAKFIHIAEKDKLFKIVPKDKK